MNSQFMQPMSKFRLNIVFCNYKFPNSDWILLFSFHDSPTEDCSRRSILSCPVYIYPWMIYYTNIDWLAMEYIKLFDTRDGASQLDYCLRP